MAPPIEQVFTDKQGREWRERAIQMLIDTANPDTAEGVDEFGGQTRTLPVISTQAMPDEDGPEPDDPWIHRSQGMRCRTCMWFVEKVDGPKVDTLATPMGRCRRRCPTMNGYPVVFSIDWCGDHKLK